MRSEGGGGSAEAAAPEAEGSAGEAALEAEVPKGEDGAFEDAGEGDAPPDAVEADGGEGGEEERHGDAGAGEEDAGEGGGQGASRAVEGTGGDGLGDHEELGEGEDFEVVASDFDGAGFGDEEAEDFAVEEEEEEAGEEPDAAGDGEGEAVAAADAVVAAGAVVLSGEGGKGGGESGGGHPGDGFNLRADALGGDAFGSPLGGEGGEGEGEHGEEGVLGADRQAEEDDAAGIVALQGDKQAHAPQGETPTEDAAGENGKDDALRRGGSHRRSCHAEGGDGSRTVDENRIQDDVRHESDGRSEERGTTVALPVIKPAEGVVVELEIEPRRHDAQVGDRPLGDGGLEVEEPDEERSREQDEAHVGESDEGGEGDGMRGIGGGTPVVLRPDGLRHGDFGADFGHERDGVAQPHEESRRTGSRHGIAPEVPQPQHIGHAVRHLDEGGGDEGHGHVPKAAEDAPPGEVCGLCRVHGSKIRVQRYEIFGRVDGYWI